METFSALLNLWAGNSPVTGEFPSQRRVTRSLDIFFDLRLNKRLSKQSWGWWFDSHRPHYDIIVMRRKQLLSYRYQCSKIRTICHAIDLWKLTKACKRLRLQCHQTHDFCHVQPYSVDFKAPGGSFWIHRLRQYSVNAVYFNKGHVNFRNDRKA